MYRLYVTGRMGGYVCVSRDTGHESGVLLSQSTHVVGTVGAHHGAWSPQYLHIYW